jgi:hypothetical protein
MKAVQKKLTMTDVKREFGIELDTSGRLAQFGGVRPFIALLKKADIKRRLTEVVGSDAARVLLQFVIGIIVGAQDMEEVERIGKDAAIAPYLVTPVSATRIPRVLKNLPRNMVEKLHEFVVSLSMLDLATFYPEGGFLDVEADSTAVKKYGSQEGVAQGYIEKDKIEPCYQYLLFRLHQTNTFLYGTIRDGSAHSQNGFAGYLKRFLPVFKETNWRVRLRIDSGFYSDETIDECTANKAFVYVKCPMSESRKNQAQSPDLVWVPDSQDPRIGWSFYKTVTAKGAEYREVFKRTEYQDAGMLFPDLRFDCVATNDLAMEPSKVFQHYNGRANIENSIKELKYDYKLGKIVTQSFDVNDILTQATIMAHVLIQHFKRLVLDKNDHKIQLSTLRWRVLNLPTFTVRGARRCWYRISNVFMDAQYFLRMVRRLLTKASFLIRPPDLILNY